MGWRCLHKSILSSLLTPMFLIGLATPVEAATVLSATVEPATVTPGQTETITATVRPARDLSNTALLFAITAQGQVLGRQGFRGLDLVAGQAVSQSFRWTVPVTAPPGLYAVNIKLINRHGRIVARVRQSFTVKSATPAPVNGICGGANGTTVSTAPTANLCSVGTASALAGTGPWSWSCAGSNGGTTAQCRANKTPALTPVNGACGAANGTTVGTAPTTNLCSFGTASALSGTGPWSWSCAGSNGGSTAQCAANKTAPAQINGTCGSVSGTTISSAPTSNLCATGAASAIDGAGPWTWTCGGSTGGTDAACLAYIATWPPGGFCGAANGSITNTAPPAGMLCVTGAVASTVLDVSGTASGPWTWSCSEKGNSSECEAASPNGRRYLNGMYLEGNTPGLAGLLGYEEDYTITGSYQDNQMGGQFGWLSTPPATSSFPVIVAAYSVIGCGSSCTLSDFNAAANGSDNAYYAATAQWLASSSDIDAKVIYAVRIDHEFNGKWYDWSPWGNNNGTLSANPIPPSVWIAGWRNVAAAYRKYLPNAKLIWNPNISQEDPYPYYPGDDVVDVIGIDAYCQSAWNASSAVCWDQTLNGGNAGNNLTKLAAFAAQHNKPIAIPEWGDDFGDGYYITQFAQWMDANNVVAQAYWDDDGCGGCRVLAEVPTNLNAYVAAFGHRPYVGTFWPTIFPPPSSGAP